MPQIQEIGWDFPTGGIKRVARRMPGSLLLLGLCCFIGSPTASHAASSLDVLDRQRGQKISEPLSRPKIKITEERTVRRISREMPFLLLSLSITGCATFPEAELFKPYQSFIGKELTFAQLMVIAPELRRKYCNPGYLLFRFIVPELRYFAPNKNIT